MKALWSLIADVADVERRDQPDRVWPINERKKN